MSHTGRYSSDTGRCVRLEASGVAQSARRGKPARPLKCSGGVQGMVLPSGQHPPFKCTDETSVRVHINPHPTKSVTTAPSFQFVSDAASSVSRGKWDERSTKATPLVKNLARFLNVNSAVNGCDLTIFPSSSLYD
ncbi:hypothetical protein Pcinc_005742 [Petrolisthes cinctipes]|uniref:Uncharacterized protein n=1 Tax=Petrolisthes cinctipes TaxID=88211 RepID=A0AAE1GE61_PETCI|nr:hypothetical protein Pcinc_005742 [Petrolisthes cinctipes]